MIRKRLFTDKIEQEIEHKYNPDNPVDRVSCRNLGKEYNCGSTIIWRIIKKLSETITYKEAQNTESRQQLEKQNNPIVRGERRGEKSHMFKNGRNKDNKGYIRILKPDHFYCNIDGYVKEHRFIMEQYLGRYLTPEEVVHHINRIKDDNRIENLKLFSNIGEHTKFHESLKQNLLKK